LSYKINPISSSNFRYFLKKYVDQSRIISNQTLSKVLLFKYLFNFQKNIISYKLRNWIKKQSLDLSLAPLLFKILSLVLATLFNSFPPNHLNTYV